jgi:hypothetical protein
MNDVPLSLQLFRDQLREAADRRHGRRWRLPALPSSRVALPVALAASAAVAGLAVLAGAGTQAQPADAAILRGVETALTLPAGTILHEQAQISLPGQSAQPFELWEEADSPYAYRVIKWGHEAAWDGSAFSSYDGSTNTITTGPADPTAGAGHETTDPASTLRSLVSSGDATVTGTTTMDGVPAYELKVTSSPDPWLVGTAYVAQSDYHPLEIDTVKNSETIVFQTYEYLPATSDNLKLLDLAAQHVGATASP